MTPKVSVVIPNYNGIDYLGNCIDSLMSQDVRSFEIIVVDDASNDESFELIQKKYPANGAFPRTKYIKHETNSGFCKSVNDGIEAAETEYIFLLNNDTVVESDCIRELYRAIRSDENIFSVAAKMVSLQNPDITDDAGDYYCLFGWAYAPAKDKPAQNYVHRKKIFSACGGAAMYRKSILEELGMFDENHFAYLEDVDLGYRAKLFGYINIVAPKAVVKHAGSASSGSRYNEFKAKLTAKNNIYLIYKNMPDWQIVINSIPLLIGIIIKTLFYFCKKLGPSYVNGLLQGFRLCLSEDGKSHRVRFTQVGARKLLEIQMELFLHTLRRFCSLF